ncbi:MAG: transglutaminaseTgpA domain-containing protein, partial [Acidimicrobiales bacterium]
MQSTEPPAPATGRRWSTEPAATVALATVTLVTVLGFSRLFASDSWLVPTLCSAMSAHALAWLLRRSGVSALWSALVGVVAVVLVTSWTVLGSTTFLGLPDAATLRAARHAFALVPADMRELAAPSPVTTGFLLLSTAGMGLQAVFADWAAFRAGALVEAVVPTFGVLVMTGGLGTRQGRVYEAVAWLVAVLAFVLLHHSARRLAGLSRPAGHLPASLRSLVAGGAALGLSAAIAAALVGPGLPGAGATPLLRWHNNAGQGSGTRTTISPLVEIRTQLLEPSKVVVFDVSSPVPSYWRLTSLESFDGDVWSADQSTRPVNQALPARPSSASVVGVVQSFRIRSLANLWLPAAYRPVSLVGVPGATYDSSSSSIVAPHGAQRGMGYTVRSELPVLDPAQLQTAVVDRSDPEVAKNLQLPPTIPSSVISLARRIAAKARTPYQKALALQSYFRDDFTYSLDVAPSNTDQAMVHFLDTKVGYCQQFAGTFAVMARIVGLPTRVAVGFTYGQQVSPGEWVVRALNAHAWPEVLLGSFGWVPFEPTPGRGAPGEQSYTNVQAEQATIPGAAPGPRRTGAVVSQGDAIKPSSGAKPAQTQATSHQVVTAKPPGRASVRARSVLRFPARAVGIGMAAALLAALVTAAVWTRLRRHPPGRRSAGSAARIVAAWTVAVESLAQAELVWRESESPERFARRVARRLTPSAAAALD